MTSNPSLKQTLESIGRTVAPVCHPDNVAGMSRKDWHPHHRAIMAIKHRLPDWIEASRAFAVAQFGAEFLAETEAAIKAEAEQAKQGRIAARAAKQRAKI